jgi:predicted  nucleic acid-binding Zn-ribbon protein
MENKESSSTNLPNENLVRNRVDKARKDGTTRGALTAGIIGLLIVIALALILMHSQNVRKEQVATIESQKKTFTEQLTARDSTINDWLNTFDQVQANLNTIKEKEKLITMKSTGSEMSADKKSQVLADIQAINNLLEDNRKKIAALNSRLKASGNTIKGLQERIASLETTMKQYETDIANLKSTVATKDAQIGDLNNNVLALKDTVSTKNDKIAKQTDKLNEAFVIYGTYKDLKDKGVLTKEGGFLGIGRKEFLTQNLPDSMFRRIDITTTKQLPVDSRKVKLITDHPANSYQIVNDNDKKVGYIAITDPVEFWKISKYAVVELIK